MIILNIPKLPKGSIIPSISNDVMKSEKILKEYEQKKQQKRDNINLAINIIGAIASIGAFITSIIAIFK